MAEFLNVWTKLFKYIDRLAILTIHKPQTFEIGCKEDEKKIGKRRDIHSWLIKGTSKQNNIAGKWLTTTSLVSFDSDC